MEKCNYKITKPKKKKRCFEEKESPFPVPVASISGVPAESAKWCYYTGQLVDNYVEVVHSGDIDLLSKMGFFGQCNIWGRHGPKQDIRWKIRGKRKSKVRDSRQLQIMSRRKYLRRLKWQEVSEGSSLYSQELSYDTLPLRLSSSARLGNSLDDMSFDSKHQDKGDIPVINEKNDTTCSSPNEPTFIDIQNEENASCSGTRAGFWEESQVEDDPWAASTEQESADFWGMSDQPNTEQKHEKFKDQSSIDNSAIAPHCLSLNENSSISKSSEHSQDAGNLIEASFNQGKNIDTPGPKTLCDDYQENNGKERNNTIVDVTQDKNNETQRNYASLDSKQESTTELVPSDITCISSAAIQYSDNPMYLDTPGSNTPAIGSTPVPHDVHVDPRCLSDHEDGTLFVVNDTDESEDDQVESVAEGESPTRMLWQPAVKRNPYVVRESLHLTFEEAFFLSYGLGCLVVLDENKTPMKLSGMWKVFCERQPNFVQNYIVYHNFRSKGWIPKPGIKFGGDFIVYKEGPPFYHSTYVVMTRLVNEESYQLLHEGQHPTPTWASLAGQNRITEQAAKDLMICYVIKPAHLSMEDLKSPKCIKHLKVQEMVVKRWLLKHERENLQYMEIP